MKNPWAWSKLNGKFNDCIYAEKAFKVAPEETTTLPWYVGYPDTPTYCEFVQFDDALVFQILFKILN